MEPLHILKAGSQDCEDIGELNFRSHTISFKEFADPEWVAERDPVRYREFWCGYLTSQPANEITWIGKIHDHVIGTVTVKPLEQSSEIFRPRTTQMENIHDVACLRLMYVNPDHQGNGAGTMLVQQVIGYMIENKYRLGSLITHAANSQARKFYEKMGWELDEVFNHQVAEFFSEPVSMRNRARYVLDINKLHELSC